MPRRTVAELEGLLAASEARVGDLEKQRDAVAWVLRAIGQSKSDPGQVLQEIADVAEGLCAAADAVVWRVDGDRMYQAARSRGAPVLATADPNPRRRILHDEGQGRAIIERATIRIDDLLAVDPAEGYGDYWIATRGSGQRSFLAVPLIRDGEALGAIVVRRTEPRPFTDAEVALVESFADQAVIAIENARLFSELQERNRELTEALAQQTATAGVLRVIASSPTDLQRVLDAIVQSAARLCETGISMLFRREGDAIRVAASTFHIAGLEVGATPPLDRTSGTGRALLDRETVHVQDAAAVAEDEFRTTRAFQSVGGYRTYVATPLLREGTAIGTLNVARMEVRPFTEQQVALLRTFADQAVIAISNTELFQQLEERNRALVEALEQQTATAEVLQAISRSALDLPAVLGTLAENAARLSGSGFAMITRFDGERFALAAHYGTSKSVAERVRELLDRSPMHPSQGSLLGRMALDHQVQHVADVRAEPGYRRHDLEGLLGYRTLLVVPLLRGGALIGGISLFRQHVESFTDRQIELVRTFADQAVIAIENTRLVGELRERTDALGRSVEQLRALAQVSGAISASLDPATVLDTVVAHATALSGSDGGGGLFERDPSTGLLHLRASSIYDEALVAVLRATPFRIGEGVVGRAAAERRPVQVPDILAPGAYDSAARAAMEAGGLRAVLAVPLVREDEVVGGLALSRRAVGAYPEETVELVQTFAAHAALAIQNARLFQELAEKSRQLEEASQHKSEFLANMSHELRTPLNAVIGFTEVLLERYFGEINEKQEEYLRDVLSSGQHLLSLINDILDLSKVEAGRMDLEPSTFDLGPVLEAGLMMVKERAQRKAVALALAVAEDTGRVEADERKVKQVLFNLLTNAVKFTPEGGRVTVSARRTEGTVEVAVQDTGVGIAPEEQGRVFEEFGQARSAAGQSEGTGLGLALCKRFVELHGGTIAVESALGRGATFTVALPVRQPAPASEPAGGSRGG